MTYNIINNILNVTPLHPVMYYTRVPTTTPICDATTKNRIYTYNNADGKGFKVCSGTTWVD